MLVESIGAKIEKIVGVACILDGVVWSMPKPNRHGDILKMLDKAGLEAVYCYDPMQGFITNKNRYLTRKEAAILADENGQLAEGREGKLHSPPYLFSEDLWYMVQKIYITNATNTDRDVFSFINGVFNSRGDIGNNLYIVDDMGNHKDYDIAIFSANNDQNHKDINVKNAHAKVGVISFVPEYNSPNWPIFYSSIYNTQFIACDSFVKQQLGEHFKEKIWINLDGVNIESNKISHLDKSVKLACYDKSKLWESYKIWLSQNKEVNIVDMRPIDNIRNANVLIGFKPVGNFVAQCFSKHNGFVWFPRNELTDFYLDSRFTHNYINRFQRFMEVEGAAAAQMLNSVFINFTEELIAISAHSMIKEVPRFTSNISIIDRVFHELNRSK